MPIGLTAAIVPKGGGFIGMVSANQIIGTSGGATGSFLPSSCIKLDSITEAYLNISNSPSNGYYLQYKDASDELTWAQVAAGSDVHWSGAAGFYTVSSNYIAFSSNSRNLYHPSAQGDFPYISTQTISGVRCNNIKICNLNDATINTLDQYVGNADSSVLLSGGTITIGGPTGSVNISDGWICIRKTNNEHSTLWQADVPASSNMQLPDGASYIYVDYNSGSPVYQHRTTAGFNGATQFHIARVYNDWSTGSPPETCIVEGGYRFNDFGKKTLQRFSSYGTERQAGLTTTSSQASGHPSSISVTAGIMWRALNKFTTAHQDTGDPHPITALDHTANWFSVTGSALDQPHDLSRGNHIAVHDSTGNDNIYIISSTTTPSSAGYKRYYIYSGSGKGISDTTVDGEIHGNVFTYFWRDGAGGWYNRSGAIALDFGYWDDNTGTLNTLTPNRYSVSWVYADVEGDLSVLFGQEDYTLANAEDASSPATTPDSLDVTSMLIARIIVQTGDTNMDDADIAVPWTTTFTAGNVDQHNDLGGLNTGDYLHITAAEYTNFGTLTDTSDAHALHVHDSAYYTETELNAGQLDGRYPASSLVNKTYIDEVSSNATNAQNWILNTFSGATESIVNTHTTIMSSNALDASNWVDASSQRYEEILASGVQYTSAYISTSTGVFALAGHSHDLSGSSWSGATGYIGHSSNTDNPHDVVWSDVSVAAITDLNDNYPGSSNVNWTKITAISSGFDGRLDTLEAIDEFDHELYATSANIIAGYVESGGTKWTDLTDAGETSLHTHPGMTTDVAWSGAQGYWPVSSMVNTLDTWYDASAQKLSASGALAHPRVTLTGETYLTLSDQEITLTKLDLAETNVTAGLGVTISTNEMSVTDYIASGGATGSFYPSSLGKGVSGAVLSNTLHSANSALHSFDVANYVTSANALERFADSSNYSTHKGDDDAHHALVTVAGAPLTLSTQEVTFNYDATEFGLDTNNLQLLGYDTISSNAQWAQNWLEASGNQLSNFLASGDEYSTHVGTTHDYSYITSNDGATDVTAAQLEELTDGSETTLHSHAGGTAGTSYWSSQTNALTSSIYYEHPVSIAQSGALHGDYRFQVSGPTYISGEFFVAASEISGLADPTYDSGAASKHYVDNPGNVSSPASGEIWQYDGTALANHMPPMTFSVASVKLSSQQNINMAKFTVPAGKDLYLWQAYAGNYEGNTVSGLSVELLSDNVSIYKISSATLQEGHPLAKTDGNIEIRFMFSGSWGAEHGIQYGSAMANVSVY